jgi:septation ring formation regulator EzrA
VKARAISIDRLLLAARSIVKNLLNIMTSATDTDIREIKDLIAANTRSIDSLARITENIARVTESNTNAIESSSKAITDLDKKIEVGFSDLKGKLDSLDGRLVAVEGNLKGLDARLWGFGGIILGAVLAALLTIFGRFLFTGNPI